MARLAVAYGAALIVLGLLGLWAGYAKTGHFQGTALIPAAFGAVVMGLGGWAAAAPAAVKHAMHGAATLGLIGIIAPLIRLVNAAGKGTFALGNPAILAQLAMAVLSLAFVALCVRSFVMVRRARRTEAA